MKHSPTPLPLLLASCLGLAALTCPASAEFNIGQSPGLFTPTFRDLTNNDLGNTTYFGWGPSTGWGIAPTNYRFDGATDDELIDNPAALQGIGGLTGTLNQIGADDYLSSSNNIYTASFDPATFTLGIPTNGTPGSGFTTIIIQGRSTNFGPSPVFYPASTYGFPTLGGDTPEIVVGTNTANQGQFWVKYEIAGNAASYSFDFDLVGSNVSIAELAVDTEWSSTGFSTNSAVPEPTTGVTLLGGAALLGMLRRRRVATI